MQDSTQDQLFQLQQTIKKKERGRKEKACLGRNLLVQGKESHIKLPFPPLPPFAGFTEFTHPFPICLLYRFLY